MPDPLQNDVHQKKAADYIVTVIHPFTQQVYLPTTNLIQLFHCIVYQFPKCRGWGRVLYSAGVTNKQAISY